MKYQKFLAVLLFASIVTLPLVCGASDESGPVVKILQNVVDTASGLVAIICTLMIIWGGIVMLTAAGAADKVSTGKTIIMWSAIGLIVALIAPFITTMVQNLVNE